MPKAVIMAGGQGERFWPLTRKEFPKYRIKLDGKASLLQKTFKRLLTIYQKEDVFVVTTKEHEKIIRKELPGLSKNNILIEPFRKNTAPAILFSCLTIQKKFGSDEIVTFFPADHLIQKEELFRQTLRTAIRLATDKDALVTIGIVPTFPATGYGYIEASNNVPGHTGAYTVKRFREKPDRVTATRYLRQENFFWNGGIFTWKAGVFVEAIRRYSPNLLRTLNLLNLKRSYEKLEAISVDYAVLEKAQNILLVKTGMDWCDMGSWDMFLEKAKRDASGNWIFGSCAAKECRNSLILNYTSEPFAALGLSEMIAVKSDQGVLICRRTRSEEAALLSKSLK